MLVDTHCHLNFKAFKKNLNDVIKNAKKVGVSKIIVPGAKLDSSRRAVEIADAYENMYAAVGVHPHHANENVDLNELLKLAQNKKTVAIGEIGLDHHQYKNYPEITEVDKQKQVEIFLDQLKVATDLNKPVIIHCREAQDLLIKTLTGYMDKHGRLGGVFHCFEGTKEYLEEVLELGFYIGFDGNITYPENDRLRVVLKEVPPDRLLLETDAPFLTPQNYRGTRCEPKHLVDTLEFISRELNIEIKQLALQTSKNAHTLFF